MISQSIIASGKQGIPTPQRAMKLTTSFARQWRFTAFHGNKIKLLVAYRRHPPGLLSERFTYTNATQLTNFTTAVMIFAQVHQIFKCH